MSLLSRSTDVVTVYAEESTSDSDGNTKTRASSVGVVARAVVQPITNGVSAESQDGGFDTTSKYRLRLVGYTGLLGAQSKVDWNGKRYSIEGDPRVYNGSRRTAHIDYVMVRG